jgi:short-subunit dehydrogenase
VALPPPSASGTALVTGASSGIGAAIARELASRGHGLTLTARREERLRELAADLGEKHDVRVDVLAGDASSDAGRDELARSIDALGLDVEVLVNSAGFGDAGELVDADRERLVEMIRLNCEAVFDLQARYLPGMVRRGRGAVINMASTAAFQPVPGNATYAATKAFVLSFSESTHAEVAGAGVTVTVVCPGPVPTEFPERAGIDDVESRAPGFIWTPVETVAAQAVEGAENGKRVVVPGALHRAGALAGQHTPRMLLLPVAKRIWRQAL